MKPKRWRNKRKSEKKRMRSLRWRMKDKMGKKLRKRRKTNLRKNWNNR